VCQFQGVASFEGHPLYFSGPHVGVMADIRIWRSYKPQLQPGEQALGDKAYVGTPDVNAPVKKPRGGELDEDSKNLNALHSWYRAGIEHVFGQIKRFNIVGTRFRGQIDKSWRFLKDVNSIIVAIIALQVAHRPLRVHSPLIDAEEKEAGAGELAAREAAEPLPPGVVLGDPYDDLVLFGDGVVEGKGLEPDNDDVDSGCQAADFRVGQKVFAWFWGLWYRATVHYIAKRGTLHLRWAWSHQVTTNYLPRLVVPCDAGVV